jgi:phosphatidylglycerophosphate synthase
MARLALSCLLAGLASELILSDAHLPVSMAWLFFGIAAFGAVLDGLDGFLARRLGTESAFGARFDMEVDAFQILCLAVIAASMQKAGWWVLLSGLLRYAFLVAAFAYPALNGQLFPSWRRKIAAVVQNCVLISLILPGAVQPESSYAAALALALLAYSFSVDVLWLALKAPPRPTRST